MENNIQIFEHDKFGEIRVIDRDGEPWFVAKDVCIAFGDTNYKRSLRRLDDDEKGVSPLSTPGGQRQLFDLQ